MTEDRKTLLQFLVRHYTLEELKTLCFKLFVDFADSGTYIKISTYYELTLIL